MKFEQHWPRGSGGGHLKFSTFFLLQIHREANDLAVKRSNVNVQPLF